MTDTLYRLKPLEWRERRCGGFTAISPFGIYQVRRVNYVDYTGWVWVYQYDKYYDEDEFPCDDAEDGKAKAEARHLGRLKQALEPVNV